MRRRLLIGAGAALLFSLVSLAGCASRPGATPFIVSLPAATAGANPMPISLVDQTGLVSAMALAANNSSSPGVEPVPGQPNTLRVAWLGGPCDDRETLVLNDIGGGRYELAIHNHPPITAGFNCDASTVARVVDISFRQPLTPEQLTLNIQYP